ncbi:hypothetical protein DSECCO2_221820 [anaerobic digester metagenome]
MTFNIVKKNTKLHVYNSISMLYGFKRARFNLIAFTSYHSIEHVVFLHIHTLKLS